MSQRKSKSAESVSRTSTDVFQIVEETESPNTAQTASAYENKENGTVKDSSVPLTENKSSESKIQDSLKRIPGSADTSSSEDKVPLTESEQLESENEQITKSAQEKKDTPSNQTNGSLTKRLNSKEATESDHDKDDTPSTKENIPLTDIKFSNSGKDTENSTHYSDTSNKEYFTIDDVVNAGGYGKFQKFLTFLAGLGWLADAFEIIILSLIGDMLACDWRLQRWQNALMSSIVFFGMMFGAPTFGHLADRYGRRMALGISMLFLFLFGAASAASPDYIAMVIFRCLMGFSLGGIAQGVTLCCEYYPAAVRGRAGFYLSYYWAGGTIGVVLTAWIIMMFVDNWRLFLFIASVPALVVFLSMKWYPESARYYLVSNQTDKALSTLERLAKMNKVEMPKGTLKSVDAENQRGKFQDLLKPTMRRPTLLFCYIWWAVAMTYYGIALITPNIISHGSLLESSRKIGNKSFYEDFTEEMSCKKLTHMEFFDLLWTSAAEFPGIIVFTFAVEHVRRKIFLGTTCLCVAFLTLFLQLEIKPKIGLLCVLFIDRALIAGIFQLLFIMTTEAFPTTLRASAMGTGSGCARLAGVIVPIVAQVVVVERPMIAIFFLSAVISLAGIAGFLLPLETRGLAMQECVAR